MARVEFNVVALGDFTSLNAQIKSFQNQIVALQKNLAGVGVSSTLAKELNAINVAAKQTILSTGQFTATTVKMTNETEKFGQALVNGKLKLADYYNIIKMKSSEAVTQMKALAVEQTKLQNSMIVSDPTKPGLLNVYTPTQIDKVANATKIAANEANLYAMAVNKGSQSLINWGKNTQWAGRQLTVGMSVPLMLFGSQATQVFKDVNAEIVRLQKVYGTGLQQPTKEALDSIKQQTLGLAKELASSMGVAVKDTAAMAADLAATGKTGNDLIVATREAMRLSKLGELDTQAAMKATVSLQNVYKLSTQDLSGAVNFLNAVENQTSTSLQDLVDGIPRVGPIVQQLGGSFKDTAVMMVAMKEAGVPAAQSANAIKSAIASLINPTKAAKEAFAAYNINLAGIATKEKGNPVAMIMDLQSALKGLAPLAQAQLIEKLFGKFQEARIQALITNLGAANSQTKTAFDLMNANSQQLAGVANAEMKTATESATGKYKRAMETFKADLIPVGEKILDLGTKLLNFGNSIAKVFNGLPGPVKTVMGALAIGVALAGPIIMLTGLVGNFVGYLMRGIFNLKQLATGGKTLGQLLTPELIAAQNASQLFAGGILEDASSVSLLSKAITELTLSIEAMNLAMGASTGIGSVFAKKEYKQMPLPGFSSGGIVPGATSKGDVYPALLTGGEAVVPAEQAKKYGPFINAMIDGTLPQHRLGKNASTSEILSELMGKGSSTLGGSSSSTFESVLAGSDVPNNVRASFQNWIQSWVKSEVEKIKTANPGMTPTQIRDKIIEAYKYVEMPIDALPEEIQGIAQKELDRINALSKNAGLQATAISPRSILSSSFHNQQFSTQFGHVGSAEGGVRAGDYNTETITDPKMRADVERIKRLAPDQMLRPMSGLGYGLTGWKNNLMGQGNSISASSFMDEFKQRGMSKWQTSFQLAGISDPSKMKPEIQKELEQWDKNILKHLENITSGTGMVSDEDVKKAEALARQDLEKVGSQASKEALAIIKQAENTLTEIRLNVEKARQSDPAFQGLTFGAGDTGLARAGNYSSDKFRPGGAGVMGGAGVLPVVSDREILTWKENLLKRAKAVWQIHSPSEVAREELGRPMGEGQNLGYQDTLPGFEKMVVDGSTSAAKAAQDNTKPWWMVGEQYTKTQAEGMKAATPELIVAAETQAEEVATASNSRFRRLITGGFGKSLGMTGAMMLPMFGGMLPKSVGGVDISGATGTITSAASAGSMAAMMAPEGVSSAGLGVAVAGLVAAISIAKQSIDGWNKQLAGMQATSHVSSDAITALGGTMFDVNPVIRDLHINTQKVVDKFGNLTPAVQSAIDKLNALPSTDPTKSVISQISNPNLPINDLINLLKKYLGNAVGLGANAKDNATNLMALLAVAGKTSLFSAVAKQVLPSVSDQATATKTNLQQSQMTLSKAKNNNGSILGSYESLFTFGLKGDSPFKLIGQQRQAQKDYNKTLFDYFNMLQNGTLTQDQFNATIKGLKDSGVGASKAMESLKQQADASKNKDIITNYKNLSDALDKVKDKSKISAAALAGVNTVLQMKIKPPKGQNLTEYLGNLLQDPTALAKVLQENYAAFNTGALAAGLGGKPGGNGGGGGGGGGGTFTGTAEQKDAVTRLEKLTKGENTILKSLRDQLSAEQKINAEKKRQLDYTMQTSDLNNQMKEALITGNYLQASQLKQQISGNAIDFNVGTKEYNAQTQIDTLQAKADLFSQALADLNDTIAKGSKTLDKNIASLSKSSIQKAAPVAASIGAVTVTNHITIPPGSTSATATAATKGASDGVLAALQKAQAKDSSSGNQVRAGAIPK